MYFKGVLIFLLRTILLYNLIMLLRLLLSLADVFTRLQVFRAVTCLAKLEKVVAIKEYKLVSIEKYNLLFWGYINSIYVDV